MEINGIAHIQITVNNMDACIPFYEKLLTFMGLTQVVKSKQGIYMVGGRTAVGITRSTRENRQHAFDQKRIGLHHVCFRAKKREDIDELYEFLKKENAKVIHPPENGPWAPGYYSLLFEDPDGIRLEVNFVPEKGLLSGKRNPIEHFPGYEDYPVD